jgi:hypothetical protein
VKNSWYRLLHALKREIAIVRSSNQSIIPQVNFSNIKNLSSDVRNEIQTRGVMVVRGVLPEVDTLKLKADVQNYIKQNPHTKAFPQDKPVVYELYWSPSQIHARASARVLQALTFANSFWHASPSTHICLKENTMYVDRLRIRQPGDAQFALGPHVDAGGIERWEDQSIDRATHLFLKVVGKKMTFSMPLIAFVHICLFTMLQVVVPFFALGKVGSVSPLLIQVKEDF